MFQIFKVFLYDFKDTIHLMNWYLSSTEIEILQDIMKNKRSISQLAEGTGLSLPTISLAVKHLYELGFISKIRKGKIEYVSISDEEIGRNFKAFVTQNPNQNPETILKGHGLIILSVCTGKGSSLKEIQYRTGLSRSSITRYLNNWRSTGILWKEGHGGKIRISKNYPDLEIFLRSYSKFRMEIMVRSRISRPTIIFNDGDTLFFSTEEEIQTDNMIQPAGSTRLAQSGFDVVTDSNYFQFSPGKEVIPIPEAIIQSIRSDVMNPRPRKLLEEYLKGQDADVEQLMEYARKYSIESIIGKEIRKYGKEEAVQEG